MRRSRRSRRLRPRHHPTERARLPHRPQLAPRLADLRGERRQSGQYRIRCSTLSSQCQRTRVNRATNPRDSLHNTMHLQEGHLARPWRRQACERRVGSPQCMTLNNIIGRIHQFWSVGMCLQQQCKMLDVRVGLERAVYGSNRRILAEAAEGSALLVLERCSQRKEPDAGGGDGLLEPRLARRRRKRPRQQPERGGSERFVVYGEGQRTGLAALHCTSAHRRPTDRLIRAAVRARQHRVRKREEERDARAQRLPSQSVEVHPREALAGEARHVDGARGCRSPWSAARPATRWHRRRRGRADGGLRAACTSR